MRESYKREGVFKEIQIPISANIALEGELNIPTNSNKIIIFSHGSGSSRKSLRNQLVASRLHQQKIGTLLFDLLTEEEDRNYSNRFNINLLTDRLILVTEWLTSQKEFVGFKIGYFGASTGSSSALRASVVLSKVVGAVVSRGGRPDLASAILPKITIPVLLIVGSRDDDVVALNEKAFALLTGEKKLKIIEGATHLFEEEGALEKVAEEAINWFQKYL
jgi:putative phosphoribosyl transferase